MQAQIPFKWQRRLGPKRSAILDTCYNIAESPDPLSAFWNWTDIHIDLLLTDEVNFSRGSITGHLSALEADGFIKRIHLRDYKRTNRGNAFTPPLSEWTRSMQQYAKHLTSLNASNAVGGLTTRKTLSIACNTTWKIHASATAWAYDGGAI